MTAALSIPVLTIDGPSGSGKGTVSQRVAAALGWHLLDSGALYRAVAYAVRRDAVNPADQAAVARLAREAEIAFRVEAQGARTYVDGMAVDDALRTEETGAVASSIAGIVAVREALLSLQLGFRCAPGLVADGRDMGTVVFPDAPYKVFLTASAEERAQRRYKQLSEKGLQVKLEQLKQEIEARDARDSARAVAPLRPAADAVRIDTTGVSIDKTVEQVLDLVRGQP